MYMILAYETDDAHFVHSNYTPPRCHHSGHDCAYYDLTGDACSCDAASTVPSSNKYPTASAPNTLPPGDCDMPRTGAQHLFGRNAEFRNWSPLSESDLAEVETFSDCVGRSAETVLPCRVTGTSFAFPRHVQYAKPHGP